MSKENTNNSKTTNEPKQTLIHLCDQYLRKHRYNRDVLLGALVHNKLYKTYLDDYSRYIRKEKVTERLTQEEFNNMIKEYMDKKL